MIDLKKTLKEAGIKQVDFAEMIGISRQQLNNMTRMKKIQKLSIFAMEQYFANHKIKIYYK